uniref:XK-related protein n=2 Tax=Iconisemion striatum TaxID=60296 RepID=A0A1A7WYZ7_9TELE
MENGTFSKYSWIDFMFSVVGVCTFLLDWGSDLWVAREFYCNRDFFWFGVLVSLMVISSVVVQMFSWFWFQYDRELPGFHGGSGSGTVLCGDQGRIFCLLHVLQLGFLFRYQSGPVLVLLLPLLSVVSVINLLRYRVQDPILDFRLKQKPVEPGPVFVDFRPVLVPHISAIRQGFRVWWRKKEGSEYAVYLTHDLSMLRLIETFCESAPQLILMIYVMLHTNKAKTVQFVSVAASTTSIAWMVVDYHRSLRAFLPDKAKQRWGSSLIYFLWNLLLIGPRVAVLALFSSVLPGFIALHLVLLWFAFFVWAWRQKTDFMDSAEGEWLYRSTVGLIWYFSWFNVAEGRTRGRSLIYHSFITVDGVVLLVTWWFYRDPVGTESYSLVLLLALPLTYLLGLLLKAFYYCCFHPKLWRPPDRQSRLPDDLPDADVTLRDFSLQDQTPSSQLLNKRMAHLATNFYTNQRVVRMSEEANRAQSSCL